jgi:hypothetical protein
MNGPWFEFTAWILPMANQKILWGPKLCPSSKHDVLMATFMGMDSFYVIPRAKMDGQNERTCTERTCLVPEDKNKFM